MPVISNAIVRDTTEYMQFRLAAQTFQHVRLSRRQFLRRPVADPLRFTYKTCIPGEP